MCFSMVCLGPQKTFVTAEEQGREMTQHPSQDFRGEPVLSFFLQVLHISISKGGFLQLCAGHLAVLAEFSWVIFVLLEVERKCSSGAGECSGVSEGLVQLLGSAFSSEGQKMFFCVIAGDGITLVTTIAGSSTGETI